MYIDIVPNRNSPPAILVRESKREGGKIVKRTIANISDFPPEAVAALALAFKGKKLVDPTEAFEILRSRAGGHVRAVRQAMKRLEMDTLLSSRPCREREVALAMIAQRLLRPASKLESAALFGDTTLAEDFGVEGVDEDGLYEAMDWLVERQDRIEKKLAGRHLGENSTAFYDVSCSSYHGSHCPLAVRGYNRDGLKLPSIVYGLLADPEGRPVSIQAYPGNTADPKTVPDQVDKLRESFGLSHFIIVGDRGMITQTQIETLRKTPGIGWISCLRSEAVRKLVMPSDPSDAPLFSNTDLAELTHPDFPGERLVACYNPFLAQDRADTRTELIAETQTLLEKLDKQTRTRKERFADGEVGTRLGRIINRYNVAKYFSVTIADGGLTWTCNQKNIDRDKALDGIYVIRTSEPAETLSAEDAVRAYKRLGNVEKVFRTFKGVDLRVRPIHHRLDRRVRGHLLLCMLAYYVEWHMRQALAQMLYADEDLEATRAAREPVAQAVAPENVKRKRALGKTPEQFDVRRWDGLLSSLSTITRNVCRTGSGKTKTTFTLETRPDDSQKKVFELLAADAPCWKWRCVQ